MPCAASAEVKACGTCPASRTVVPAMSNITAFIIELVLYKGIFWHMKNITKRLSNCFFGGLSCCPL
jgi:hypothetical protein